MFNVQSIMYDPVVRFELLYGIAGTSLLAASAFLLWHLRRSYWKRLRQSGDRRAKEREIRRERRPR